MLGFDVGLAVVRRKYIQRSRSHFVEPTTHGGVRRERQRVELRGPQENGADERSPAEADAVPQGLPVPTHVWP